MNESLSKKQEDPFPKKAGTKDLYLNRLPIRLTHTKYWFLPVGQQEEGFASIRLEDFSVEQQRYLKKQSRNGYIFGNFSETEQNQAIEMDLTEKPEVGRNYLNWKLQRYFEAKQFVTRRDFIRRVLVLVNEEKPAPEGCASREQYSLSVQYNIHSKQFLLMITPEGSSFFLRQSLEALTADGKFDLADVHQVIYRRKLLLYEDVIKIPDYRLAEIYPRMNADLYAQLQIKLLREKPDNPHTRNWNRIDHFYREHLLTDEFLTLMDVGSGWEKISESAQISDNSAAVAFGDGYVTDDIITGFKNASPWKPAQVQQIRLFFVYALDQQSAYEDLRGRMERFFKLGGRSATTVYYDLEMNIPFTQSENALTEIRQKISALPLKSDHAYLAIFLSPYDRHDADLWKVSLVPGVKESLLKRGIMSQVIDENKFSDPETIFNYWLPNIALATISKFGGIPWIRPGIKRHDLVIGFGIYRSRKNHKELVGTSVCFRNDGSFESFDAYPAKEEFQLVSTFQKALSQYRKEYPDISRIVVHYYKDIRSREYDQMGEILRRLKMNIPLIVLRINRTHENSYLLCDNSTASKLPLNGTYLDLGNGEYLFYINQRSTETSLVKKAPEGIRVGIRCFNGTLHEDLVQDLLQQLYDYCFMNWRSVRTSRIPATVKYPSLLASYVAYFKSSQLPEEGRRRLWVL
jgi:hypothetical protein